MLFGCAVAAPVVAAIPEVVPDVTPVSKGLTREKLLKAYEIFSRNEVEYYKGGETILMSRRLGVTYCDMRKLRKHGLQEVNTTHD